MTTADELRERRARLARADAVRSIMPLFKVEDAAAAIIERRIIESHKRREAKP